MFSVWRQDFTSMQSSLASMEGMLKCAAISDNESFCCRAILSL